MKKTFFIFITLVITYFLIEFSSWTIVKLYKFLNNSNLISQTLQKDIIDLRAEYEYFAFYGWKKKDIETKDLKIKNHERITTKNENWDLKSKIFFHGGSTIWGAGVSNGNTIPSKASNLNHNYQPVNLGEEGYVSGQSLNRLIENIDRIKKNDHVVFYSGVNDIIINCQNSLGPNGNEMIQIIRKSIDSEINLFKIFKFFNIDKIMQTNTFILLNGIGKKIGFKDLKEKKDFKFYACDQKEYAIKVANNLVRHWKIAETLVKSKKAKFTCILQPNPYTANFETKIIPRKVWQQSTLSVYPLIREASSSLDCFKDLSDVFKKNYYYDKCCHLNAEGNEIIARKIIEIIIK
jgi:hypothetical protein|tara:strand:- start:352 stop:1398 length:1047 start_codon:yes stop_codon:yes gene_type:complete